MTAEPIVVGVYPSPASWGWERILRQEGLPFVRTEEPVGTVTVFAREVASWTEAYVSAGGVAVVSGAVEWDGVFPASELAVIHRFRPPESPGWAVAPGVARVFPGQGLGELRIHEDRKVKGGNDPDVFPAVLARKVGSGTVVWTGLALTELLASSGDRLRRFSAYSDVTERVASVDKAEVADALCWMLQAGFAAAGLPFVRAARFPDGAQSALVLRVDVDGLFGSRAGALAQIGSECGLDLSFFFNGSLAEEHPGEISDAFEAHDIGHHGYVHNVFDDVGTNVANLERGAEWVRRTIGREPSGFVAPRGLWNRALEEALLVTGHTRSGDFAFDFDSHPFRTSGGVLQIPVHPYSPERAVAYAEDLGLSPPTPETVRNHYLAVLDHQSRRGRPVHLYGHPEVFGAMADDVLPQIARAAETAGLPSLTVSEYAGWWERREAAGMQLSADRSSGEVDVAFDGEPLVVEVLASDGFRVRLEGEDWNVPGGGRRAVVKPGIRR